MPQITLRGLDPDLEKEVRRRAQESGKSLSRVIVDILEQATGVGRKEKRPLAHSLRDHAGSWSEEEASLFLDLIRSCEQIDEEMWR